MNSPIDFGVNPINVNLSFQKAREIVVSSINVNTAQQTDVDMVENPRNQSINVDIRQNPAKIASYEGLINVDMIRFSSFRFDLTGSFSS